MNLRISQDGIRLRVSVSEAERLLNSGELSETFPWPCSRASEGRKELTVKVRCIEQLSPELCVEDLSFGFEVTLCASALKRLCAPGSVPDAAINGKFGEGLGERICFEIDLFSRKQGADRSRSR